MEASYFTQLKNETVAVQRAAKRLIDDGLAYRKDYQEMPPRVEYGLTELGKELFPIIDALADFGNYYQSMVEKYETSDGTMRLSHQRT